LTGTPIKILYVCPFAHYTGHPPRAAIHEPQALARAGAEVTLLTFHGIIDNTEAKVPHVTVLKRARTRSSLQSLVRLLFTRWSLFRWPFMLLENLWTLAVAIRLKRKLKYDIIHLRDGEPFLFIPFLLSLPLRDCNWVVALIGGNLYYTLPPPLTTLRKDFRLFVYATALSILNSRLWRPLYRWSLARNHFVFLAQNEAVKQTYDSYMHGVFSEKVVCVPRGADATERLISKQEARKHLGLPQDKPMFLSFGVPHPGKDLETVFCALKDVPGVLLVQAGKHAFSVGANPGKLSQNYAVLDRVIIRDYYIPEEEKPYYFFAADAAILSYTKQFLSTTSLLWEACHFGTPVIASDNGQLKELIEAFQSGLLFTAQDADSLRQAMRQFINLKPEDINVFKSNCRRFRDEFSIEKWAQKCLEIYRARSMTKGETTDIPR
jgi:glycosyltransferase involved in cell wall biosynthesis